MELGTYVEHGGRPAVRFTRTYPHPVERVWSAVTSPQELEAWFPSKVSIELHEGGAVEFSGYPHAESSTGAVLACEPPNRLAFTWGEDELHFELEAVERGQCRLTLINVLGARDAAARNAAGWSVCLAELDKHLAGRSTDGPHSDSAEAWQPLYDAYIAAGMPSGAWLPQSGS
jgi:uncharacterized protein YndB with AHSA1/START domain